MTERLYPADDEVRSSGWSGSERTIEPDILICARCGLPIPDPGNRWDYGGKLIAHMEAAHTPHAVDAEPK